MTSCCCADSCPAPIQERRDSLPIDPVGRKTDSVESLTILSAQNKNWWYWIRFAFFMASPFLARQIGIVIGKRIMARAFSK